jgi:UDP-glucose 4-epimerase
VTPRHVIVAGGTGFLGRELVASLLRDTAAEITVLCRTPHPAHPDSRVRILCHDLGRPLTGLALPEKVDLILHCASQRGVTPEEVPAEQLFGANVDGTLHLMEYGARAGAQRLVYLSSGGVCGYHRRAIRENARFAPPTPYLMAKLAGEMATCAHGGVPATIVRLFFPYGPGQTRGLIPMLRDRIERGQPIVVGSRGAPSVNPVHVADAARYIVRAALDPLAEPVLNVAGSETVSMRTLARRLARALGGRAVFDERGAQRLSLVGDTEKLQAHYGTPETRLQEGLRQVAAAARVTA